MFLTCFICKADIPGPYKMLSKHFRRIHNLKTSNAVRKNLTCGQAGCKTELKSFGSFGYHIRICDKAQANLAANHQQRDVDLAQGNEWDNNNNIEMEEQNNEDNERHQEILDEISSLTAKMFLNLRAKNNTSHVALDYITEALQLLVQIVKTGDIQINLDLLVKALKKNNSQRKRLNLWKSHFGFVEPEEMNSTCAVRAPRTEIRTGQDGLGIVKRITNTFHYIPLKKTLTVLFSNDKFRDLYFQESTSADDFMRSNRDGEVFKTHPLFSLEPNALRLQLFFDDVETANPLGSKRGVHQLGNVYFQILNMPEKMTALLSSIYALAISYTVDLNMDDQRFVWDRIMEEIGELESPGGMNLRLPGDPNFKIRGTIATFCADTKGAHEVGGFLSPSANKFCRLCLTDRSEIIEKKTLEDLYLRTRENYDQALEDQLNPSETGVKSDCLLNRSSFFHFAENLVLDPMHDILEGVVPFLFKLVMYEYVVNYPEYNINAKTLNSRIKNFHYGPYDVRNKPSPSFKDDFLRKRNDYRTCQKAAQNWTLIRLFPIMLGDLLPEGEPFFQLILTLLRIMDIVFSPIVKISQTIELEDLTRQLFEQFESLFPDVSPINKFHHLEHYGQCIRANGPAIIWCCIRFESFHNISKRIAHSNFNYQNIPKTAAYHIQTISCANFQENDAFSTERMSFGPEKKDKRDFEETLILLESQEANKSAASFSWICYNGWKYQEHSVVLITYSHLSPTAFPIFGKIKFLFLAEREPSIVVSMLQCEQFDEHYHAFQVKSFQPEILQIVKLKDLPVCRPLWLLEDFVQNDIVLKYVGPRHYV